MTLAVREASELPSGGEPVFSFSPDPGSAMRGGLIFEVSPTSRASWRGQVFGPLEAESSVRLIKVWPESSRFLVISNGVAFLAEADSPSDPLLLPVEPVQSVTQAHDSSCIIVDFSVLVCVDSEGIRWVNDRLLADGFEGIDIQVDRVVGRAYIPPEGWTEFSIRLRDGHREV